MTFWTVVESLGDIYIKMGGQDHDKKCDCASATSAA